MIKKLTKLWKVRLLDMLKFENMFGEETITRKCVITLMGGYKVVGTLSLPKPKKAMFPDEMERNFIKSFNESQPNMVNKAVSVHILRN